MRASLRSKRPFVRVGSEFEDPELATRVARRRAVRAPAPQPRDGQPPRPAAHGLRQGSRRGAIGGAEPSRASSKRSTKTDRPSPARGPRDPWETPSNLSTWPQSGATTTTFSASPRRGGKGDQVRVPAACARAPSRTSRASRTQRSASARPPRPTRCSPSPRRATSTTASGTRGSGPAASVRPSSTSPTSPISSPSSSGTSSSACPAAARGRSGRGADVLAEVDHRPRGGCDAGSPVRCRSRWRHLRHVRGQRRRARDRRRTVSELWGTGRLQSVSAPPSSASSSGRRPAPSAGVAARSSDALRGLPRQRPDDRGAHARGRDPRGIHDRPTHPPDGKATRAVLGGRAGDVYVPRARAAARAFRARRKRHRLDASTSR